MSRKEAKKKPHKQARKNNISRADFAPFKVKVPKQLLKVIANDNKLKASLDTWLVLRSKFHEDGKITLNKATRADLANLCMCCVKTFTSRLKHLASLGLIEYRKDNALVYSWQKLSEVFNLLTEPQHKLRFHFIKYNGSKRIFDILEAKFMEAKETECRNAAIFKLTINPIIKQEIENVAGGVNLEAVLHSQLFHYLNEYRLLNEDEKFVLYNVARADSALSSRQWSNLFGLNSRGGMAYKKRKLIKAGLITVEKRAWLLDKGTHTTRKLRKCILGTAPRINGQTVFQMPDKIVYLSANCIEQHKELSAMAN